MKHFLALRNKALNDFGVSTYQQLWQKAQDEGYDGIAIDCTTTVTKATDDDNRFHAIFSSEDEDRHGDIVRQDFELSGFKKNPVFLDSHNYFSIESIIGKIHNIRVEQKKLQGDIEFAVQNPRGQLAKELTEGGFLNVTSIGFIPKQFSDKGEILKSELLEVSGVSVSANDKALIGKNEYDQPAEPAPDDEPTEPAEPAAPAPEPEPVDHRTVLSGALSKEREERAQKIKSVLTELRKIDEHSNRKRKAAKALRELLSQDIAA